MHSLYHSLNITPVKDTTLESQKFVICLVIICHLFYEHALDSILTTHQ